MNKPSLETLSADQLQMVHVVCNLFERSLRQGPVLTESQLLIVPEEIRDLLFGELLKIELDWRRENSDMLDNAHLLDDLLRRFPLRRESVVSIYTRWGEVRLQGDDLDALSSVPRASHAATFEGTYRLVKELGTGGMGTVYLAEQIAPVQRRVAVKLIKSGLDSKEVLARFECERQALGTLNHPSIARVLDAGSTNWGRPYFVTELVDGASITRCREARDLSIPDRLKIFCQVCRAVQHAHTKGVIHRNIKPANILVSLVDGKLLPKLTDFGVARATAYRLSNKTIVTQVGQLLGSIEYLCPEQVDRGHLDIDTRSDIYSLGIVLYELLTGATPVSRDLIGSLAFEDILETIRHGVPAAPSQRIPSARIPRELDRITMRAIEKSPDNRYQYAGALADDLENYLCRPKLCQLLSSPFGSYRNRH